MLVFTSTTAFADGETGHGTKIIEPTPTPTVAAAESIQTVPADASDTILNQILNIIYNLVA